ncbi:MAG: hypothetical protein ACYCU7_03145 [Acidimicrobiales bacterium]
MTASTSILRASLTAIGWQRVVAQRRVTMTGSTSNRLRSISKLADPEPITTRARSSATSAGVEASGGPTACRLRRWMLRASRSLPSPSR